MDHNLGPVFFPPRQPIIALSTVSLEQLYPPSPFPENSRARAVELNFKVVQVDVLRCPLGGGLSTGQRKPKNLGEEGGEISEKKMGT